jgi:hypothetical protein
MPSKPNIISVGGGSPSNNPDQSLIDLIAANAAEARARASARANEVAAGRLTLDQQKFLEELRLGKAEETGLFKLFQGLEDTSSPTPEREAIESGALPDFLNNLLGVSSPTPDDPAAQRRVAVSKSLPDVTPGERDPVANLIANDPDSVKNAFDIVKQNAEVREKEIAATNTFTEGAGLGGEAGIVPSFNPDGTPAGATLTKEVVTPQEDPTIPQGGIRTTTLTERPEDGPILREGFKIPDSEREKFIGLMGSMSGPDLRALTNNEGARSVITSILNRKPLELQILEEFVKSGTGFTHLETFKDALGNAYLIDKHKRTMHKLGGQVGAVFSAMGKDMPVAWRNALLKNFTLDDLRDGKISVDQMHSAFRKEQSFKEGRGASLDLMKSDSMKAFNIVATATKNAFTADGLPNKNLGDQALIVMFNKLIDPTSVVREGEFDRMDLLRNIVGSTEVFIEKIRRKGGAGLNEGERTQLREFAMGVRTNTLLVGMPDLVESNDIAAEIFGFDKDLATPPRIRELVEYERANREVLSARKRLKEKRKRKGK